VVLFEPIPEPAGYPCFPGNNPDWTIQSGSKPGPQPRNLSPLLTLGLVLFTRTKRLELFQNIVFHGQYCQYDSVYNFKTMHNRSYFCLSCSSKVTIYAPAIYSTLMWLLTVFQLELHTFQIPTTMSDSESLNTMLLEVVMSSSSLPSFRTWDQLHGETPTWQKRTLQC